MRLIPPAKPIQNLPKNMMGHFKAKIEADEFAKLKKSWKNYDANDQPITNETPEVERLVFLHLS